MVRSIRAITILALVAAACIAGCENRAPLADAPHPRVVSFSPSLTDILYELGLGDHVVGVTNYCDPPAGADPPRVGDAFDVNAEAILTLEPDLILTQVDASKFRGVRDLDSSIRIEQVVIERLEDIPAAIREVGELTGRPEQGLRAAERFTKAIRQAAPEQIGTPRVIFVMGTSAPKVFGAGTFLGDLIELYGGVNAASDIAGGQRYLDTHNEAILAVQPDVLICHVSDSGARDSAKEYWMQWSSMPAVKSGRVFVVTDDNWLRPSPKLADLAPNLAEMLASQSAGGDHP